MTATLCDLDACRESTAFLARVTASTADTLTLSFITIAASTGVVPRVYLSLVVRTSASLLLLNLRCCCQSRHVVAHKRDRASPVDDVVSHL